MTENVTSKLLYSYSLNGEDFTGKFPTPEEAKIACVLDNKLEIGTTYFVGENKEFNAREFISPFTLADSMHSAAVFEMGSEEPVGKWPDISTSKYHELRELLAAFFEKNYPVDFYKVVNIRTHISGE